MPVLGSAAAVTTLSFGGRLARNGPAWKVAYSASAPEVTAGMPTPAANDGGAPNPNTSCLTSEPARTGADLGHGAGDVGAGDEREVQRDHLAYRARGHQQVGRVERGGGHPDLQLSRAGLGDREVFDGERAGRAVSGNDESFHEHPFQGDRLSLSRHPVRTGSPRPVSLSAFRLHLDRRLEVSREDAPRLPAPPRRRSGLPASPPW
jgi:hypothetical protein